jgi:hypothetical protein
MGITLTVCCDESVLSGGYLLPAIASPWQRFATPFASIYSIGVIMDEFLNEVQNEVTNVIIGTK